MKKLLSLAAALGLLAVAAISISMQPSGAGQFPGTNGQLLFVERNTNVSPAAYSIVRMNPDGTGRSSFAVAGAQTVGAPYISPDGTKIAVSVTVSGIPAVKIFDISGTVLSTVKEFSNTTFVSGFGWSPDGTKLALAAYTNGAPGVGVLSVINADGTGETVLVTGDNSLGGAQFSPDGTKILFSNTSFDNSAQPPVSSGLLETIQPDGTNRTTVYQEAERSFNSVNWTPDGNSITFWNASIYSPSSQPSTFDRVDADGTDQSPILSFQTGIVGGMVSPDGTKLAYFATPSGTRILHVADIDGSNDTPIYTPSSGYSPGGLSWTSLALYVPTTTTTAGSSTSSSTTSSSTSTTTSTSTSTTTSTTSSTTSSTTTSSTSTTSTSTTSTTLAPTTTTTAAPTTTTTIPAAPVAGPLPAGTAKARIGGQVVDVSLVANPDGTRSFVTGGYTFTFDPRQFVPGRKLHVTGSGMTPGSRLSIVIYSDPTVLGDVIVGPNGSIDEQLDLPAGFPPGVHTLELQTADGSVVLSTGVEVTSSSALPYTGAVLWPALIGLVLVGLGMMIVIAERARRSTR